MSDDETVPFLKRMQFMLAFDLNTAVMGISADGEQLEAAVTREQLDWMLKRMTAVRDEWDRRLELAAQHATALANAARFN